MTINSAALLAWCADHAGAVVGTPAVLAYEPKARIDYDAAGSPTVAAVWLSTAEAVAGRGGLASTSARVELTVRLHRNALGDGAAMAATETALLTASDALVASFFSDIDIAGNGWFDPRGQTGEPWKSETGYLDLDRQLNRVATCRVGIVIDDAWTEVL